jgi:lipoprotein NlpI
MEVRVFPLFLLFGILLLGSSSVASEVDAQKHHDNGIKLYRLGNVNGAIVEFTKAIEINPRFDRAYTNRGIMWQETGEYDKAITDYDKAIEINPKQFAAYNSRGNAWRFKGNFERAIADFNTAIGLNPKHAVPFNNRGSAYMNKEDYSSAIADFSKAIELDSKYPVPYYNRGCTLYRQGKFKESLPDLQKAMATGFTPGDYPYLMLLISSQKVSKENFSKFVEKFEHFVSTQSSNAWIRRIIVFYLHENVPEQQIIVEALKTRNEKERKERLCEAYYYLGEYRLSKGDRKGAEESFLKSIETNVFTTAEYLNAKSMLQLISKHGD